LKLLKFREEKQKKEEKKPLPRPSQQEVSVGGAMVGPALMRRTGALKGAHLVLKMILRYLPPKTLVA
jgi:hypothetical protein